MTVRRPLILAAALLATGLGACSRSEPDPAPTGNAAADVSEIEPPSTDTGFAPAPAAAADTNAAVELPSADTGNASADATDDVHATTPDEQMLDDASATGMTARSSRRDRVSDDTAPNPDEGK